MSLPRMATKRREIPEYRPWQSMRDRCLNPRCRNYMDYGGRGITIAHKWDSFDTFYADMGSRPSAAHSLDRIEVNGNYEPSNCRWATWQEQERNRRNNHLVTANGDTRCLGEWAHRLGVSRSVLSNRIFIYGWPPEIAVLHPAISKSEYRTHACSTCGPMRIWDERGYPRWRAA